MTVVDAHVHLLPERLAVAVRAFFADAPLAYPTDPATVLGSLADAGIDQVWNLPYARRPGTAQALNEWSRDLAGAGLEPRVVVTGGFTVHPGDEWPEAVVGRALDELGLRVLKLHCSVGDFDADDVRLDPVWTLVGRRSVPVVVHVGHGVSGETESGELAAIDRVAGRFPEARVVIAHCAHPATAAAIALIERHPNVYADLTTRVVDPVAVDDDTLERLWDRFLLGTDAPNTAIPAADCIERLAPLSDRARTAILGGNAVGLVG